MREVHMFGRGVAAVLAVLLVAAGCGTDDAVLDDAVASSPSPTAEPEPEPSPTAAPSPDESPEPTEAASVAPATDTEDDPPVDLISYGAGTFPVGEDNDPTVSRVVLDGLPGFVAVSNDATGPAAPFTLTVELLAPSVFDSFAIPPMSSFGCCANTHIRDVTVEGSATGPDSGFEELASFEVAAEPFDVVQTFPSTSDAEVRWLRITLAGSQNPDAEDYRPTNFTDLMGYGTQQARPLVDDEFTGIFLTGGGGDGDTGNRMQLFQDGALVTGCREVGGAFSLISGGIENGVLKLTAPDGIPTFLVINSEGQLVGAEIGRSYQRLVGDPGGAPTQCAPVEDEPPLNPVTEALDACRPAIVYGINFDVDRDEIRPDATPALEQILAALQERPDLSVTIEGHTDADGSDEYNQDLSQRRAESVVAWLTDAGIEAGRLTAIGKGEAEPIADNESDAGKAANRRVEVEGCA